jgi:hypothetical protein
LAWDHPIISKDHIRRQAVADDEIQARTIEFVDSRDKKSPRIHLTAGFREDARQVERMYKGQRYSRCGRQRVEINGHPCLGEEGVELGLGVHVGVYAVGRRGEGYRGHRTLLIRGWEDKTQKKKRDQNVTCDNLP